MDFNWKRKSRLQEQLRFFGASKTRFISCYAKKPRIKVKLPSNDIKCTDSNRDYLMTQAQSALGSNAYMMGGGLGMGGAAGLARMSQEQGLGLLGASGLGMGGAMAALGSQLANQQLVLGAQLAGQQHAIEQAQYHERIARQQMLLGLVI